MEKYSKLNIKNLVDLIIMNNKLGVISPDYWKEDCKYINGSDII